ncbi:MAG: hypothetical protein ACXVA9_12855 [Bdellovibrionales bacterium]
MRIFLIFLTLLVSSQGFADTSSNPLWNCTLAASLRGDGDFFLRYGRDSWKGHALLVCTSGGPQIERKEVDITFNGAQMGFGVNESSVISMSLDVVTTNVPASFQVYAYVLNKNTPAIVWRNESGGILIEANVISDDIPGIQASLQQGNLYIR